MRVFLDSDVLIYLVEQTPGFGPRAEAWLVANPCDIVSSELVRMEALILPARNNAAARVADFEDFFRVRVAEFVPLSRAVFDRATGIRARLNIRTPDALHLAAATEVGCDAYLTNDGQLTRYTGVRVELL